ncbi:predicted protein [Chaetomium globosum CBS 148.51]|uniref:Uncharacterized protein n=1 Tax=Chaetomium globosum (strain ATCC 6205 / CBS 148.51 / DSM 1962 / NBRC 6347 / NRRL 1970) TaxID=306901 RepID=Q2GT84_CHAGB|nr:uncharacterized protein CHGG_08820 [Chaetomium globosum CBS 148.51]EAQ84806.1 predicted protein [Chaetomium globosum CBS 148.51]
MPLANTLPTGSKPSTPGLAPSTITRVTLASGYRAYHPSGDSSSSSSSLAAQPPKPKKTVRFVVGEEESAALTEGSDSEDGDEYDFVNDFSLEEAEGWVPVMVAEEDHGDDWMSLTGSWIKMGDAPGDVKKVQEKVVAG